MLIGNLFIFDHCTNKSIAVCKLSQSESSDMHLYILLSSANNKLSALIKVTRSFINKRNNKGPIWLPCGTPDPAKIFLDTFDFVFSLYIYWDNSPITRENVWTYWCPLFSQTKCRCPNILTFPMPSPILEFAEICSLCLYFQNCWYSTKTLTV